jgi:hypothetical protein
MKCKTTSGLALLRLVREASEGTSSTRVNSIRGRVENALPTVEAEAFAAGIAAGKAEVADAMEAQAIAMITQAAQMSLMSDLLGELKVIVAAIKADEATHTADTHPVGTCLPLCSACEALLVTTNTEGAAI